MKKLFILFLSVGIGSAAFCAPAVINKSGDKAVTGSSNVDEGNIDLLRAQYCAEVSAMHCGEEMCATICESTREEFNATYSFFVAAATLISCE
jgi:hypothetical protein